MKKMYLFIFVCIHLMSCKNEEAILVVAESSKEVVFKNGLIYHKEALFTGQLVSYYNSIQKNIKSTCFYKKGKKNGVEKRWYLNGQLNSLRTYTESVKTGIHQGWWKNGKQKFIYHFNEVGEYQGSVKEWYSSGMLYRDFNYSRGKEEGSQKMWKRNGNLKANYVKLNGERFGLIGLKKCNSVATN